MASVKITCERCNATYDIDDGRIPASGMIMKCPGCMHAFPVTRPQAGATPAGANPGGKALAGGEGGAARYHVRRRTGKTFGPFVESAILSMLQGGKLEGDEELSTDGQRWIPLRQVPAFASYAPVKSQESAAELEDLPAPKGPSGAGFDLPDLPAPKGPSGKSPGNPRLPGPGLGPGILDLPAPKGGPAGLVDLPAPKRAAAPPLGIRDLPPPKTPRPAGLGITDLPAPKGPAGLGITDLPAPKGPAPSPVGIADLPAPKGPAPSPVGIADLPAPKGGGPGGLVDLPTPKRAPGLVDLPAPKGPGGMVDLPTPKRPGDMHLMTPKGPQPAAAPRGAAGGATAMGVGVPPPMPPAPPPQIPQSTALGLGGPDITGDELFDIAPAALGALDLGEVDLPSPQDDETPPPASIFSAPGLLDTSFSPPPPSATTGQLHVDLDAVEPSSDLGIPALMGRPVEAELPEEPEPELAAPDAAAASPQAKKRAPRKAAKPTAAEEPKTPARRKKLTIAISAAAGLLIAAGAIGALTLTTGSGQRMGAATLSKFRAEILDDNFGSYIKAAQRVEVASGKDSKLFEQRALGAEAYALAAIAHRGGAKAVQSASALVTNLDKSADENAEIKKARAAVAVANGKAQEGEAQLTEVLSKPNAPVDPVALLLLGWAQMKGNRTKSAEATFQKALAAEPKLAGAAYGVALCRAKAGDVPGASSWMQRTLGLAPGHFEAGLTIASERGEDAIQGLIQAQGGKASPPEIADAWAATGGRQLAQVKLDEAEKAYKKALELDPDSVSALIGVAQTYFALGRYREAKEKAEAARAKDPSNLDAFVTLARANLALGAPFVAQELLQLAAKLGPKDARVKLLQGKVEESVDKDGAQERASALYKQAVDQDPKLIEAYQALVQQALRFGRPEEARALTTQAEHAAGDTADVRTLSGEVALAIGDAPKAQAEFQAALERMPNHLQARLNLAAALEAQKKPDSALAELEKIRAKVPSLPGLSQRLGSLYQALGRIDDASKAFDAALKMPGAPTTLKFAAASFFYSVKKCDRSREIAEQITNEDTRNADAIELYARTWECTGKMDQALLAIKHAVDVSDKPQYHLTYAHMLERLDKGQEALAEYETAANRGHLPDAYIGRARLNLNFGANREAIHDLDLAIKLDKNRGDAYALQGKAMLNLQQYKPAEQKLQQAVRLLPKDGEAHYWLAEACRGSNDFGCAGVQYRTATQLGLSGEDQGDAYYKLGMYERSHGNQSGARSAFQKCIEVGSEVQKGNCGKESQTLGGYR